MAEKSPPNASAVAQWSEEDRAEAARNFHEFIAILREWDGKERMKRAKCMLDSASPEE